MKLLHFFLYAILVICIASTQQQDPVLYQRSGFRIYKARALYGSKVLYDAAGDLKKMTEEEGACAHGMKYVYSALSLIGNCYCYEKRFYDEGGQGECSRPPSSTRMVMAVNVQTQEPVSILDLFDERSLVAAIKKDEWVKKLPHLHPDTLSKCTAYSEVIRLVNRYSSDGAGNAFNINQFAVLSYDDKTGEAAVRLIKTENIGFNHSRYLQLGLSAKVRAGMVDAFKENTNFYVGKFRNGLSPGTPETD